MKTKPPKTLELSPHQIDVLKKIAVGVNVKSAARELRMKVKTVEYHLSQIGRKLGGTNAALLAHRAIRMGLVELLPLIVCCLFLLHPMASGAPAPTGPTAVTLTWNPQGSVDVFKLYSSTNAAAPLANWTVITNAPGTNFSCTITVQPGPYFFYLTASNFWGESDPSPRTNTPPVPVNATNLSIKLGNGP